MRARQGTSGSGFGIRRVLAAVLALVGAGAVSLIARRARRVVRVAVVPARSEPFGLDRGVEAVDVHHRDDEGATALDDVRQPCSTGLVAVDQLEPELERRLVGGPLACVVGAEHDEVRPAVAGRRHVLGDLDAMDAAALDRLQRQREDPHEGRVIQRELLELLFDVGKRPVGRPAARQVGRRALARPRAALGALLDEPVLAVAGRDVGDLHAEREAGVGQLVLVLLRGEEQVLVLRRRVVGGVEPERTEVFALRGGLDRNADELERVAGLGGREVRADEPHGHIDRVDARAPARLHGELLPGPDDGGDDLAGPDSGGAVEDLAGVPIHDRDIPVTARRAGGPDADEAVRRSRVGAAVNTDADDRACRAELREGLRDPHLRGVRREQLRRGGGRGRYGQHHRDGDCPKGYRTK